MPQDGNCPRPSDSEREVASEEFLFHLYRGAELLQDARVHEAKEELEAALHLQPRDPKGQDLLAVVYFRLGLYPRAIQIYEQLRRDDPRDHALLVNLALCYLKTGQSQSAREVLEQLVQAVPDHRRGWGYLGLAYERLGDLEKAEHAFDRAGHVQMAKRVAALREQGQAPPPAQEPETPQTRMEDAAIRATAAVAFQELDSGELSFALAEPAMRRTESGTWRAIELGTSVRAPSVPPPPAPATRVPPRTGNGSSRQATNGGARPSHGRGRWWSRHRTSPPSDLCVRLHSVRHGRHQHAPKASRRGSVRFARTRARSRPRSSSVRRARRSPSPSADSATHS